jgi:hypothetical protein
VQVPQVDPVGPEVGKTAFDIGGDLRGRHSGDLHGREFRVRPLGRKHDMVAQPLSASHRPSVFSLA